MNIMKKFFRSFNEDYQSLFKNLLNDSLLSICDIGARGGVNDIFSKVDQNNLLNILVEAEEKEAEKLASSNDNYKIINKVVSDASGKTSFNHTLNPSYSSSLKPHENNLKGYYYFERNFYSIDKVEHLESLSLSEALNNLDISELDILKIDVQGAENIVFDGIDEKHWNQINCIHTEAYPFQYYENSATIQTILDKLYQMNYELFDLEIIARNPKVKSDGELIFGKELLSARPFTKGFLGRNGVYDLLLFKKQELIMAQGKDKIIRAIATFCLFEYFDQAVDMLVNAKKIGALANEEYIDLLETIQVIHYKSLKPLNRLSEAIKIKNYKLPIRYREN